MRLSILMVLLCATVSCKNEKTSPAPAAPAQPTSPQRESAGGGVDGGTTVPSGAATGSSTGAGAVASSGTNTSTTTSVTTVDKTIKGFGYIQPNVGILATRIGLMLSDANNQTKNCTAATVRFLVGAAVQCEGDVTTDYKTAALSFYDSSNNLIATYSGAIALEVGANKNYEFTLSLTGTPMATGLASSAPFKFFQNAAAAVTATPCTSTAGVNYQHGQSYQETIYSGNGYTTYTRYCCQGTWSQTACAVTSCVSKGKTYPAGSMVEGTQTDPAGVLTMGPDYCCAGKWSQAACQ